MRFLRTIVFPMLFFCFFGCQDQPEVLRVATEGAYPPFSYLDQEGRLAGFDVEIAQALCDSMEIECRMTRRDWDELIPGLVNHDYDFIVACMAKTPAREKQVAFTNHYFRSKTGFIGTSGTSGDFSLRALEGKPLGSQAGTAQSNYLHEKYGHVSEIMTYPTMGEAFDALAQGEVYLVLTPLIAAYSYLNSEQGRDLDFIGQALAPEEYEYTPAHIAVRKGDEKLRSQLNNALQDIRLSGEYDQINRKYFPFSIY